ncbi:MAG TPA: sigma-70 family RNA polymerase sigma factor [Acidobacteriaceae bacterium]|jgi:RNA polymerase sigma-70 factor (ECF subfamily)|nr:sigma-70 family RNA polymerase sigma factor [Acidobacteriaceae bacterium]
MALLPWKRAVGEHNPTSSGDIGSSGDATPSAFEDLALPLLPSLYNVARWLSQNAVDAEDLVQETFLKALRGFDSFEQGSNFKAWIFRILRNTYLTSRSGLAALRTVSLEEELQQWSDSSHEIYPEAAIDRLTPEINLMRLADRAALQSAMEKLPPLLLEAILLCDVEEMKYKEIAAILDIPVGTVMSRIARGRALLRQSLKPDSAANREARP